MITVHESLWCDLDDAELLVRGQMVSDVALQYEVVEKQKKDATKAFAEQLSELRSTRLALSQAIKDKREKRMVECAVDYHSPASGMKRFTRLDTGEFVRDEPMTANEMQQNLFAADGPSRGNGEARGSEDDDLYHDAVRLVFEFGKASTSLLQRRLRIGYGRAAHLIDMMERNKLVGPADGSKPRELLEVDKSTDGDKPTLM